MSSDWFDEGGDDKKACSIPFVRFDRSTTDNPSPRATFFDVDSDGELKDFKEWSDFTEIRASSHLDAKNATMLSLAAQGLLTGARDREAALDHLEASLMGVNG